MDIYVSHLIFSSGSFKPMNGVRMRANCFIKVLPPPPWLPLTVSDLLRFAVLGKASFSVPRVPHFKRKENATVCTSLWLKGTWDRSVLNKASLWLLKIICMHFLRNKFVYCVRLGHQNLSLYRNSEVIWRTHVLAEAWQLRDEIPTGQHCPALPYDQTLPSCQVLLWGLGTGREVRCS